MHSIKPNYLRVSRLRDEVGQSDGGRPLPEHTPESERKVPQVGHLRCE